MTEKKRTRQKRKCFLFCSWKIIKGILPKISAKKKKKTYLGSHTILEIILKRSYRRREFFLKTKTKKERNLEGEHSQKSEKHSAHSVSILQNKTWEITIHNSRSKRWKRTTLQKTIFCYYYFFFGWFLGSFFFFKGLKIKSFELGTELKLSLAAKGKPGKRGKIYIYIVFLF